MVLKTYWHLSILVIASLSQWWWTLHWARARAFVAVALSNITGPNRRYSFSSIRATCHHFQWFYLLKCTFDFRLLFGHRCLLCVVWAIECTRLFLKMHCCVNALPRKKQQPMCRRYLHNLSHSRMYVWVCIHSRYRCAHMKTRFAVPTLCHDKWLEFFNQMWTSYCKISHSKFQFETKKNSHVCESVSVCFFHVDDSSSSSSSEQKFSPFQNHLAHWKFIRNCLSEARKKAVYCICCKS